MELIVMSIVSLVIILGSPDPNAAQLEALEAQLNMDRWEARAADCRTQLKLCKRSSNEDKRIMCGMEYEKCEIAAYKEWCRRSGEQCRLD
jgi:hypothetical protein